MCSSLLSLPPISVVVLSCYPNILFAFYTTHGFGSVDFDTQWQRMCFCGSAWSIGNTLSHQTCKIKFKRSPFANLCFLCVWPSYMNELRWFHVGLSFVASLLFWLTPSYCLRQACYQCDSSASCQLAMAVARCCGSLYGAHVFDSAKQTFVNRWLMCNRVSKANSFDSFAWCHRIEVIQLQCVRSKCDSTWSACPWQRQVHVICWHGAHSDYRSSIVLFEFVFLCGPCLRLIRQVWSATRRRTSSPK